MNDEVGKNRAKNDIEKIEGNNRLVLVAPHGNKHDDENTGVLTREIAKTLNCYAIINEIYRKPPEIKDQGSGEKKQKSPDLTKKFIDLNRRKQVEQYLKQEFLEPLEGYVEEIIEKHGSAIILWMHGIKDDNINANSVDGDPSTVEVLIGVGQGEQDRFTAEDLTVKNLIGYLRDNGKKKIVAALAKKGSDYCGNYENIMNQYFRLKNYPLSKVQSVQLEIKFTGFREADSIPDAANAFSAAFLKLISPQGALMTKPGTDLVDQAYQELAGIFSRHFENAMMEAGQYLIDKFYGGDIEKARKKEPIDGESFFQLISRLHAKGSGGPSKSWVYNAIKLVVESHDLKDFQTYGKLNLSHKILLLPVSDRRKKEQLIEDAVKKNLTVIQFKEEIKKVKGGKSKTPKATKSLTRIIDNPKILFNDEYKSATEMGSLLEHDIDNLEDLLTKAQAKKTEIDREIKELTKFSQNYRSLAERIGEAIKKNRHKTATRAIAISKGEKIRWRDASEPRIISVSKRTDIPAYYGKWFMNRLNKGFVGYVNPIAKSKYLVSLKPEHVACFLFWSKNFAPFMDNLRQIKDRGYNCYFHFTITGLPKPFEPNVIETSKAIDTLKEISNMFSPDHINWRYDPVVISDRTADEFHLKTFERLASQLEGYVRRCYFSFPTLYRKVKRSIDRLRNEESIALSYPDKIFKINLANKLADIAQAHGITMHSCCGEYLVGDKVHKAHCVDGDTISNLFFDGRNKFKPNASRQECGCADNTDIGAYDTCANGCFYCYANANKEKAQSNLEKHDPNSAFLGHSYEESERWIIESEKTEKRAEEGKGPIRTTPGKTKSGKPFDFYIQRKVDKGILKLEKIDKEVLGTPRDLEVYREIRKGRFIVDWFNRAPDKEYCREYWADLRIGKGPCGYRCPDCFLGLTHRTLVDPSRHTLYENVDEFIKAAEKWLSGDTRRNTLGLGTDSSDSLLYEGVTRYARTLIPLFADPESNQRNKHLLLLTKSANVHYLKNLPTKNVTVSFSLNPQEIANLFEGRYPDGLRITPSIKDRLEASRTCHDLGFETRWRIDPIIPVDNWQNLYREFFRSASRYRPQRITLGTYRQMGPGLKIFSKKWGIEPMPWEPPMKLEQDEGVHGQLPRAMRIEIYQTIKEIVDETWTEDLRPILALCKENIDVRKESGVLSPHCNCE